MKRSEFLRWLGLGFVGLWTGTPLRARTSKKCNDKARPTRVTFYSSYVRGTRYGDYRRIRKLLKKGMKVELRSEPNNPYDRYAISIWWKNFKLGYIPAVENVALAGLMDAGIDLEARIVELTKETYREIKISVSIFANSRLDIRHKPTTQSNNLLDMHRMRISHVEAWPKIHLEKT